MAVRSRTGVVSVVTDDGDELEKLAAWTCKSMLSKSLCEDMESTSSDSEEESDSRLPEVLPLTSGESQSKIYAKSVDDIQLASSLDSGISLSEDIYLDLNGMSRHLDIQNRKKSDDELMAKSVIIPGFEKLHSVPLAFKSRRQRQRENKAMRERSLGDKWFGMPAVELTQDMKRDLKVLKMRDSLDPKRFYRKSESSLNPKYIQIGTVVEGAGEFYSARIPKRKRKQTLVDELLADDTFRQYSKRKVDSIRAEKPKGKRRANRGKGDREDVNSRKKRRY